MPSSLFRRRTVLIFEVWHLLGCIWGGVIVGNRHNQPPPCGFGAST